MIKQILFICFMLMVTLVFAQGRSKDELKHQQQQLEKEIAELTNTLNSTKKNKNRSMAELAFIKRKIEARQQLVNTINNEMKQLDNDIYLANLDIYRLQKELAIQKDQYAKSLVFAYKNRSNYDYLNFIFSSSNFNDAIKRIEYLKSYRRQRETQVANINKTQMALEGKKNELNYSKSQKNKSLQLHGSQLKELENDRKEKDAVVASLKSREKDIVAQLRKKQQQRQQLKNSIAAIMKRENDKAIAEEKARKEKNKNTIDKKDVGGKKDITQPNKTDNESKSQTRSYDPLETTPQGLELSLNFESNKGKLPWPVDAGFVSGRFGVHKIDGTEIDEPNDGIEIEVQSPGTLVKSVADGVVKEVWDIGGERAVIVNHGKYYTTYSHLSSVLIQQGSKVKAGTVLGKAGANENGRGEIYFLVSTKNKFINPELWLRKR